MKYKFTPHHMHPGCTVVHRRGIPIGDATPNESGYSVVHYATGLTWNLVDNFASAFELLRDTDKRHRNILSRSKDTCGD